MNSRGAGYKAIAVMALVAVALVSPGLTGRGGNIAWAQSADPPARVGRLNYISGPVSYAPGGINQWATATLNYPLTTGTALWTDDGGRAELHIGSTAVRMDQLTEVHILNLDDQTTQLRVAQGTIDVGLRQLAAGERFEVATPNAAILLVRPGHYRIQADAQGVWVTVRTGQADVTGAAAFTIPAGYTALITTAGYQFVANPELDEFGQWALARETREGRAAQAVSPYVATTMTGYEDLAYYGTWRPVSGYGTVWFPSVPSGWAPYRNGRWVWVSPWGWTWVDHSPWGFAPFHYGRWVLIGTLWAWVPGPIYVRPVWAPALVVFLIIGNGIGWFPLAPHEPYVPSYWASPAYYNSINITIVNVTIVNVTQVRYVYRNVPQAVSVVPKQTFHQSGFVVRSHVPVSAAQAVQAGVTASAPVKPTVVSVLGQQGNAGAAKPPAGIEHRPVVVSQQPPAPPRPQVVGDQPPMKPVPVTIAEPVKPVQPVRPIQPVQPGSVQPAPAPQPARPADPASNPAPVVMPTPAPVPTPRPVRPMEPATRPVQPVPQATPEPVKPVVPAPAVMPTPAPVPTPRPIRPMEPLTRPVQPVPQATPEPARPVVPAPAVMPTPAPVPTPRPVRPIEPITRPSDPIPQATPQPPRPMPQPVVVPTPQPVMVPTPRPAPAPPQAVPGPQQVRPVPQQPAPVRPVVCDERSPYYDPRQCPPKPRR